MYCSLGGGEFGLGKAQTVDVFNTLVKDFENIQIIAISGKNEKLKEEFTKIVEDNKKQESVKILEFTDKIPEIMSVCDLVITKPGGLTTSESLASNLPLIIINPIPGQEEENAKFLENNGVGIWIRDTSKSYEILESVIENPEKLQKMKQNTEKIAKKHSTENICKILLDNA